MLDQSLKIAMDPFFGANEHQYLMNQEFVATEIKYSMVYEELIPNIKNSPSREMHEAYYYSVNTVEEEKKMQEAINEEQNAIPEKHETENEEDEEEDDENA